MSIFIAVACVGIRFEQHGGCVEVAIENGKQKRCIAILIAAINIHAPVNNGTHHICVAAEGCILKDAQRHGRTTAWSLNGARKILFAPKMASVSKEVKHASVGVAPRSRVALLWA
jgi:hypothetical protein